MAKIDTSLPQNVASRLTESAAKWPEQVAVAMPLGRDSSGRRQYQSLTFRELEDDTNLIADGLLELGIQPGMRLVLMVRPGIDFISLVFALMKAGAIVVLIDPGMGRKNLIKCLEDVRPDGFVAISMAHAIRCALRRKFPNARFNVTVGHRWFWRGPTLAQLRTRTLRPDFRLPVVERQDPAAIIFTTGSTGPPKGVLYRHGNFNRQVDELREHYQIQPGEIDLPGFPLFALFNSAMGVTTVIPDMDPTRPADVDPKLFVEAMDDWQVTQAFGSPALWNTVGRYCEQTGTKLPTLHRALSAGAPVPPHVIERVKAAMPDDGDIFTPYGATEALPVASISGTDVLTETRAASQDGRGTCVGGKFPGIEWRVIEIDDGPITDIVDTCEVPQGQQGELMVCGEVVTKEYVTRADCNPLHKVADGDRVWHRMGDVGYLDEDDRFWFCGRKAHRVRTTQGTLFTIPCEAIINNHQSIYRSALVGIGQPEEQRPVMVVEPWPEKFPQDDNEKAELVRQLREIAASHDKTAQVGEFLIREKLPVDIRHNSKIFREQLAVWAAEQLS